jgi:hypothetical protein
VTSILLRIKKKYPILFLQVFSKLQYLAAIPQTLNYIFRGGNPPDFLKRKFIRNLLKRYRFPIAIESGTYLGKTTSIISTYTQFVYSIEIDKNLYYYCLRKKNRSNIEYIIGDSAKILSEIVKKINCPLFLFLDGHASGGVTNRSNLVTPLRLELASIDGFEFLNLSLILIDDSSSINGTNDYPSLDEIEKFAQKNRMNLITHKFNMIVLVGNLLNSENF